MAAANESLLVILQKHFNPREEGWLWVAFYNDGDDGGVVQQLEGCRSDESDAVQALAVVINGVSVERAYLALCRNGGRPAEADRELWRGLRALVSAERLVDLVVFNDRETWSMRGEDQGARQAALG